MADSFNTYFSTVCAPSETDDSNVPTHSVYLSNPIIRRYGLSLKKLIIEQCYNTLII